ncbi:GxxExxY protein [bacterium]|nr:GxxExxY protein [bacterium]
MNENDLSRIAIGACLKIHRTLGPGLLESVYEKLLSYELTKQNIKFQRQVIVPVIYKDIVIDLGFRADFILEDLLVIELKSVEQILVVHKKQLLTYLKLSNKKLGLLVNFNVALLKNGIVRMVNGL